MKLDRSVSKSHLVNFLLYHNQISERVTEQPKLQVDHMFSEKLKEHEIAKQNEIEQLEYNLELKHKKQIEFLKAEAEKSMQLMKQKLGDRERMISELEVKMSKFQSSSKKSNFNTTHGDEDVGDVVHQKMRLERLKEAYKS